MSQNDFGDLDLLLRATNIASLEQNLGESGKASQKGAARPKVKVEPGMENNVICTSTFHVYRFFSCATKLPHASVRTLYFAVQITEVLIFDRPLCALNSNQPWCFFLRISVLINEFFFSLWVSKHEGFLYGV